MMSTAHVIQKALPFAIKRLCHLHIQMILTNNTARMRIAFTNSPSFLNRKTLRVIDETDAGPVML